MTLSEFMTQFGIEDEVLQMATAAPQIVRDSTSVPLGVLLMAQHVELMSHLNTIEALLKRNHNTSENRKDEA